MSDNYMNYSNAEEIFGGYAQSINKIKPTPITYAAYQALSAEEKAANRYMITDYPDQTGDYNDLTNRPHINNVTLAGNKSAHDLGLVAAETGKGLSSNDYTTAEKTKLAGLENYDDTVLAGRVSDVESVIPSNASSINKLATADDVPDTTDFIQKSVTVGLVKNDGTIDTNTYVQSSDLGTAAGKDFTDRVSPGNRGLVESQSVYNAIDNALSSIYTPRGDLSCAELTSELLIAANIGNVYEMTDAGTTSALFLQGAGESIAVGSNVGIINAGAGRILFNLMPGAFDLTGYQTKELDDPITIGGVSRTEVEPALGALNTAKADKNEMSVTAGTGADADKTVIQLKSGTTATVLHAHQDISGKVDKSATVGLLKNDGTVDTNTYVTAADISGKADKSEMSIVDGSGASADKTTITLKSGTSTTVLKEHQDISGKAEKSEMSVTPGTGANADKTTIQLKEGTSTTVLTTHQDLSGKVDKVSGATNGNFAGLNASGEVVDSGKKASDFSTSSDIQNIYEVMGKNGAKNLVPYPYYGVTSSIPSGLTVTVNADGSILLNGSSSEELQYFLISRIYQDYHVSTGRYRLTGIPEGLGDDVYLQFGCTRNGALHSYGEDHGLGRTAEMLETDRLQIVLKTYPNKTFNNVLIKPMLRFEADLDSTYQPYAATNRQLTQLTQNKMSYADNGILGAKNLIPHPYSETFPTTSRGIAFSENSDGSISFSGTADDATVATVVIVGASKGFFLPAGTYKLTGGSSVFGGAFLSFYDDSTQQTPYSGTYTGLNVNSGYVVLTTTENGGTWTTSNPYGYEKLFTINSGAYVNVQVRSINNTYANSVSGTIYPMLRLASDPDDTYAPYAETNKQLTDRPREFVGTQAEWTALSTQEKNKYTLVSLTDDNETGGTQYIDLKSYLTSDFTADEVYYIGSGKSGNIVFNALQYVGESTLPIRNVYILKDLPFNTKTTIVGLICNGSTTTTPNFKTIIEVYTNINEDFVKGHVCSTGQTDVEGIGWGYVPVYLAD